MFAKDIADVDLQSAIDNAIGSLRLGQQPNERGIERLAPAFIGAEWSADLVSLWDLRQAYDDGCFDENPIDISNLADEDVAALVRRIGPLSLSQHDPDSTRIYCQWITHTDGECWVLASFYGLELVPIGLFRSEDEVKAACLNMGYLVGNDGADAQHLESIQDFTILHFFRLDRED